MNPCDGEALVEQLTPLAMLLLTSKGAVGSSFIVLAATLSAIALHRIATTISTIAFEQRVRRLRVDRSTSYVRFNEGGAR